MKNPTKWKLEGKGEKNKKKRTTECKDIYFRISKLPLVKFFRRERERERKKKKLNLFEKLNRLKQVFVARRYKSRLFSVFFFFSFPLSSFPFFSLLLFPSSTSLKRVQISYLLAENFLHFFTLLKWEKWLKLAEENDLFYCELFSYYFHQRNLLKLCRNHLSCKPFASRVTRFSRKKKP